MTNHTPNDHSNTKKLSLKERFVKYLVENAEIFNSATAAMTASPYIPLINKFQNKSRALKSGSLYFCIRFNPLKLLLILFLTILL